MTWPHRMLSVSNPARSPSTVPACAWVLALAFALLVGGCQQVLGIEPPEAVDDPCSACRTEQCSAQLSTCQASAPCSARSDCDRSCPLGDNACTTGCAIERAGPAYADFAALRGCEAARCADTCHVSCGDMPVVVPADSANACRSCVESRCCDMAEACLIAQDCIGIAECTRAQSTPDEVQVCLQSAAPEAAYAHASLETCLNIYCAEACALGSSWTCLDGMTWPTAATPTILVGVRAVENQGVAGIQGLLVQACGLADTACAKPMDTDTTDQEGLALLNVSTTSMSGFVGFTGSVRITDPTGTYLSTMAFANPPITRDSTIREVPMATQKLTEDLAEMGNVSLEAGRGQVALYLKDCAGRPAAGVSLSLSLSDDLTIVRYAQGFGLSETATSTDKYGTAFVFNAVPGSLTMTGTLVDGTTVGVANVQVADGWVTEVTLSPTP